MVMPVAEGGREVSSHPFAANATTGETVAGTVGTYGSPSQFPSTATMTPQKTQQGPVKQTDFVAEGMREFRKKAWIFRDSSILSHLTLPFQLQISGFLRMFGSHLVQGVEIGDLDPWDYFTMAKRARLPDTTAYKKAKWSTGSGGKWHYCESSQIYIKVWETSYYSVWMDPDGWAHNVIWFLSDLVWEPDGTVWEAWDWDYVKG